MKILKFEQDRCMPCKKLDLFINYSVGSKADEVVNLSLDNEDTNFLKDKFNIMSTPVLILVDDEGKEVERINGFDDNAEDIIEMFHKRG